MYFYTNSRTPSPTYIHSPTASVFPMDSGDKGKTGQQSDLHYRPKTNVSSSTGTWLRPALSSVLFLLLLHSAAPSMLIESETAPIRCVKAFSSIGPDSPYNKEFIGSEHSAPLVFIDASDTVTCPDCCHTFSTSSSASPSTLRLPPSVVSLVANRTVLLKYSDLEKCAPSFNVNTGLEPLHVLLEHAGARAVIVINVSSVPGLTSNCVGSFSSISDQQEARASLVPFVAVGNQGGERLVESLSRSDADVYVRFTYDVNPYLQAYKTYFEVPFKAVSFLTVAFILLRCYNLGLRRSPSTGLPLLTSTKNYVVLAALPVAAAIVATVSLNGLAFLDEGSKLATFLAFGLMLPFSNLASSVLIARFWNSRQEENAAEDPAKAQPVKTLLIVAAGLTGDIVFSSSVIFSARYQRFFFSTIVLLLALGYTLTTVYFFFSGLRILRSLSSDNKSVRSLTVYLLLVAVFTLMIMASYMMVSKDSLRGGGGGSVLKHG